jgi:alpha-glucoside transport system ATP-binding protein
MTFADRIVVLSRGIIEQVGSPLELYTRPANLFVAQFIGSPAMNILPATVTTTGDSSEIELVDKHRIKLPIAVEAGQQNKPVHFGVRPEDLTLCDAENSILKGKVSFIESLGEVTMLYVNIADHDEPIVAKLPGIIELKRGDKVAFAAKADKLHLFDEAGLSLVHS